MQEMSNLLSQVVKVNDRQSKLLASKDVQAYQSIIAMDGIDTPEPTAPQPTEDEIALQEAMERGMTNDDLIYFKSRGLIEPDAETAD